MQLIDNQSSQDPAVNLALEEHLVRRFPAAESILLFYVNDPAVVIGRNQIPFVEVNLQKMWRQKASVVRRISGGGAVYHGPGNLNFSLIQARRETPFPAPGDALQPVLAALKALGLPVRLNARHDILLDGKKVTGTAQFRAQGKCLTHGTLLVSADLETLKSMLSSDCEVSCFKGPRSVRSPVTNLNRLRPQLTTVAIRDALMRSFANIHGTIQAVTLAPADWADIHRQAREKYRSWDWNVGRSPVFKIRRGAHLPWGWCAATITIKRGIVTRADMELPDAAPPRLESLAGALEGSCYHPGAVSFAIRGAGLAQAGTPTVRSLTDWLCPSFRWRQ